MELVLSWPSTSQLHPIVYCCWYSLWKRSVNDWWGNPSNKLSIMAVSGDESKASNNYYMKICIGTPWAASFSWIHSSKDCNRNCHEHGTPKMIKFEVTLLNKYVLEWSLLRFWVRMIFNEWGELVTDGRNRDFQSLKRSWSVEVWSHQFDIIWTL